MTSQLFLGAAKGKNRVAATLHQNAPEAPPDALTENDYTVARFLFRFSVETLRQQKPQVSSPEALTRPLRFEPEDRKQIRGAW